MKILGFCGLPGSGKSTAIDAIRDLGIIITMGDVIRKEAKKQNIEPSNDNLGRIAIELRKINGPEIIAKKCVEMISELSDDIIIIDGIRSLAEIDVFRKLWRFPVITIDSSKELRFKRLSERGRHDDSKIIEKIKERDKREIEFGVEEVVKNADYRITNDSTKEELKKRTRTLVLEIIQNY
jgi:dephospho-CoA kinase